MATCVERAAEDVPEASLRGISELVEKRSEIGPASKGLPALVTGIVSCSMRLAMNDGKKRSRKMASSSGLTVWQNLGRSTRSQSGSARADVSRNWLR